MPTKAEEALDRNIAGGTDVALSLALKEALKQLGEVKTEVGGLRRRLTALESEISIFKRERDEPTRA